MYHQGNVGLSAMIAWWSMEEAKEKIINSIIFVTA